MYSTELVSTIPIWPDQPVSGGRQGSFPMHVVPRARAYIDEDRPSKQMHSNIHTCRREIDIGPETRATFVVLNVNRRA